MSLVLAPRASKERMRRSSETLESADSIFAIRDWLEAQLGALAARVAEFPDI